MPSAPDPRQVPRWREHTADALGLLALLLVLLDSLRPSLMFAPTITAGGDTPCHYPTAVWFFERLLPEGRLHGWYPGAYLGHPLLLYYFPLPFLLMSALAPFLGMPIAFKLGTALGVLLLPFLTYAAFRLMDFRFPAPLLGAASAFVFLFVEDNPIWGGTLAGTLTGEFSYMYGMGLGVLFLSFVYRAYARGDRPFLPAFVLALTALAHGYAVLWAGLSASYFLYTARRPARTLSWLLAVAGLAFAFAGVTLLPLLGDWRWTTPYVDPWITITARGLLHGLLWPLFAAAVLGLGRTLVLARRTGGPDHRLLFLIHAALMAAALAAAAPALGVLDVRFVPFAQFAACLAGGATLGLLLRRRGTPEVAALGLVLLAVVYAGAHSRVARRWSEWSYSGLEAKALWPAFRGLSDLLKGSVADPRVAVEYSQIHERAGSIRVHETLPFFSGRSTLEGVYSQAALNARAVYYLASELGATAPNPFRTQAYSRFDPESALSRLRLFNVREVVALSLELKAALESREDVALLARLPPYTVFRLKSGDGRYVVPLRYAPLRSAPRGWRAKAERWFARNPLSPAHLVFTDDPRFAVAAGDEGPLVPLARGVAVEEVVEPEQITITTNRPGHPLLVKVSYHPRWEAQGADGPFLVSPALMMVIPREATVRLVYARRNWTDRLGLLLTVGAVAFAGWSRIRQRGPVATAPAVALPGLDACDLPPPPRRWGGAIPAGLLLLLFASRFLAR